MGWDRADRVFAFAFYYNDSPPFITPTDLPNPSYPFAPHQQPSHLFHISLPSPHYNNSVFGTEVVYDVPNAVLMEQKKFVKFGLTTENFRRYVGLIRGETLGYLSNTVFAKDVRASLSPSRTPSLVASIRCLDRNLGPLITLSRFPRSPLTRAYTHTLQSKTTAAGTDAFKTSSEITIFTASATLQGKEVRAGLDASFAQLYHDLDGGFTPLVSRFAFRTEVGGEFGRTKSTMIAQARRLGLPNTSHLADFKPTTNI